MRTTVTTIRLDPNVYEKVKETSAKDLRKYGDQINYLLTLGLKYRDQIQRVEVGHTQIDMEVFR